MTMQSVSFEQLITFSRTSAATYVNSAGNVVSAPAGTPRFDYDPATLAPKGLLIESQRTNLLLRSEEFDNASWVKNNATITANSVISPDGLNTADKLVESSDTSNKTHFVRQNVTVSIGLAYTFSVFVKAGERDQVGIQYFDGTTIKYPIFSLVDGSKLVDNGIGNSWSAKEFGNGWWRFSITTTSATTSAQLYVHAASGSTNNYIGDGSSGIYIWGAQFEAGAFATSYIPTVASQVTRTADVAAIVAPNFAPWYNQSEGTFVVEFDCSGSSSAISADDATNSNFVRAGRLSTTGRLRVLSGGVGQADVLPANGTGWSSHVKLAVAYKADDFAASASGGVVATDTSGSVPTVTQMRIGTSGGGDPIDGHIRSIRYFPTRLSNAQLQALTA